MPRWLRTSPATLSARDGILNASTAVFVIMRVAPDSVAVIEDSAMGAKIDRA